MGLRLGYWGWIGCSGYDTAGTGLVAGMGTGVTMGPVLRRRCTDFSARLVSNGFTDRPGLCYVFFFTLVSRIPHVEVL